jgi:hypothetical protein
MYVLLSIIMITITTKKQVIRRKYLEAQRKIYGIPKKFLKAKEIYQKRNIQNILSFSVFCVKVEVLSFHYA